jgi:hypothetical protein
MRSRIGRIALVLAAALIILSTLVGSAPTRAQTDAEPGSLLDLLGALDPGPERPAPASGAVALGQRRRPKGRDALPPVIGPVVRCRRGP